MKIVLKPQVKSVVEGFEGPAVSTWINNSKMDQMLDGGITGFFKNVKKWGPFWYTFGEEFHGIIKCGPGQTGYICETTADSHQDS